MFTLKIRQNNPSLYHIAMQVIFRYIISHPAPRALIPYCNGWVTLYHIVMKDMQKDTYTLLR